MAATGEGVLIRVRDLAVVRDAFEPEKVLTRMNGRSGVSFLIYKKESADMIRTVDESVSCLGPVRALGTLHRGRP